MSADGERAFDVFFRGFFRREFVIGFFAGSVNDLSRKRQQVFCYRRVVKFFGRKAVVAVGFEADCLYAEFLYRRNKIVKGSSYGVDRGRNRAD